MIGACSLRFRDLGFRIVHMELGGQFWPELFTRFKLGFLPDKLGVFGVCCLADKLGAKCLFVGHSEAIVGLLDV